MDLRELRLSGLLEQYVIGTCSIEEKKMVEQALLDYPELKKDLYQIGAALELYASNYKIEPSPTLKDKIMSEARNNTSSGIDNSKSSRQSIFPTWLTTLMALGLLVVVFLFFSTNDKYRVLKNQYDLDKINCDSLQAKSNRQFAVINDLQSPNNQFLALTATPKYNETELTLIHNQVDRKNYLQVANLPTITVRQSFQLWSLKTGEDPIPLTVFQGDEGTLIPIDFEEGTRTYAITIEVLGGRRSPTLDDLIGTVNVSS